MHQIAEWLEKLGMSEYTRCFAENDIVRRQGGKPLVFRYDRSRS